ncbi:hypothetical protein Catovirus_1_518 [Catovirus CTV1]|uniref:Uncharacterized protein n=1 Tax=Catovirus CTV1 TaxID=1977631 RepID=A0A1V0S9Y7_9VIRU|nr:hypothetical protein Catovirus_1_518 [Catovirus CTV1]
MNKITICFDNDDRTIEVDEDTIKKVPFLQSYYNFNNNIEKTNTIKLDCSDYDEIKLVLETVVSNKINIINFIKEELKEELNSYFDKMDFFGVMSKSLGEEFINCLTDHLEEFNENEYYSQLIKTQNFVNNKEQQIISVERILFDKLIPKMSNYKNIIPFYKSGNDIFLGEIPFPIDTDTRGSDSYSMDDFVKNKFVNIMDDNGKINKLFLTIFCLTFRTSACIDSLIYDQCSFKTFTELLYLFSNNYDDDDDDDDEKTIVGKSARIFLKNSKILCKLFGSELLDCSEDHSAVIAKLKTAKADIDWLGQNDQITDEYIIEIIGQTLTRYNILILNLRLKDKSALYMTEEELNIIKNRDKYVKIIQKHNSYKWFDCGFIRKIE